MLPWTHNTAEVCTIVMAKPPIFIECEIMNYCFLYSQHYFNCAFTFSSKIFTETCSLTNQVKDCLQH